MAEEEVRSTIRRLPAPLRREAEAVPVVCEPAPSEQLVADGYDPDLLGLFIGGAFDEETSGNVNLPPQILLFLENLWDLANNDDAVFRKEVRKTYLHELGHYLGMDEIDLEERGLD